mmetsp:Transcript_23085/g.38642  ORF Transcript_23085/g.38642 Transcript_23085/m.38642 type:complete len:244 (-) Transcript_23085:10-741(-)
MHMVRVTAASAQLHVHSLAQTRACRHSRRVHHTSLRSTNPRPVSKNPRPLRTNPRPLRGCQSRRRTYPVSHQTSAKSTTSDPSQAQSDFKAPRKLKKSATEARLVPEDGQAAAVLHFLASYWSQSKHIRISWRPIGPKASISPLLRTAAVAAGAIIAVHLALPIALNVCDFPSHQLCAPALAAEADEDEGDDNKPLTIKFPASKDPELFKIQKTLVQSWGLVRQVYVDPTFNGQGLEKWQGGL